MNFDNRYVYIILAIIVLASVMGGGFDLLSILFTIPGVPSIYYGSEWGIEGDRSITDLNLRPQLNIDDFDKNENSKQLEN